MIQENSDIGRILLFLPITMNYYEEDGLHVIKLMAKVYLRKIKMSLLLVWKRQLFFWSFFICNG